MNPQDEIKELMSKHRLAGPGPDLQEDVLRASKSAWESSDNVPWRMPVLRFAASLAAAVILVALANRTAPVQVSAEQRPAPPTGSSLFAELQHLEDPKTANRDRIRSFVKARRMQRELLSGGLSEKTREG